MKETHLTMTRGDSQDYVATFRDANGALYDVNGWTAILVVKEDPADVTPVIEKSVTVSESPSLGTATIPLLPADTESLEVKGYWFKLKVLTNTTSPSPVYTVLKGTFTLEY